MSGIRVILEHLLFSDHRPVTALTLARHAGCDTGDALKEMETFYSEKQKSSKKLHAFYMMSGVRSAGDASSGKPRRAATLLVRDADAALQRAEFEAGAVDETLFALHTQEVEDLYTLLLSDRLEEEQFLKDDWRRGTIACTKSMEKRGERIQKEKNEQEMKKGEKVKEAVDEKKNKPLMASKNQPQLNLSKLLTKPASTKKETPKKKSPVRPEKSPSVNSDKGEDSNSPVLNRKRQRKIVVDEEEENEKETRESPPAKKAETKGRGATKTRAKDADKKRPAASRIGEDEDDLFDNADESPEKRNDEMEEEPSASSSSGRKSAAGKGKKAKAAEPTFAVPLRRSPRKHKTPPPGPVKKVVMEETTYTDEDGFLVTKVMPVEKEISVAEQKKEKETRPLQPSKQLGTTLMASKGAKAAPKNQSKISSFFKKT